MEGQRDEQSGSHGGASFAPHEGPANRPKRRKTTRKEPAHSVVKHRNPTVTRKQDLTDPQRHDLRKMLEYRLAPRTLRTFVEGDPRRNRRGIGNATASGPSPTALSAEVRVLDAVGPGETLPDLPLEKGLARTDLPIGSGRRQRFDPRACRKCFASRTDRPDDHCCPQV